MRFYGNLSKSVLKVVTNKQNSGVDIFWTNNGQFESISHFKLV